MNARTGYIHPATIGDALNRLEILLRQSARDGYAQATRAPDHEPAWDNIQTSLMALGDVCRMIAPSLGARAEPMAAETFPSGMVLHFQQGTFGSHPRPGVLLARDLETTFTLYQRCCRHHGDRTPHTFNLPGEAVTCQGVDRADALLELLAFRGEISDLPFLPDGGTCLTAHYLPASDAETISALETRLNRAVTGFRRAAE